MSVEQKEIMSIKKRKSAKNRYINMFSEERKSIIDKRIQTYSRRTPQERQAITDKRLRTYYNKTLEKRRCIGNKIRKALLKPEIRDKTSKQAIKLIKDPTNSFGNYPKRRKYKDTNITMKSSYEEKFASFLDAYNIHWLYEPKAFYLKILDKRYIPDFYLFDFNCYVEIKSDYYITDVVYRKIYAMKKEYGLIVFLMSDYNWKECELLFSNPNQIQIEVNKLINLKE